MNSTCIFLPPAALGEVDPQLEVARVQSGRVERLAFSEALAAVEGGWRLVLPVEAVTVCAVRLPTQKARWLRQALPFAVEELLAEDVDQMHLALGGALADGRHRVYALRRAWLAQWLALAGDKPPQAVHCDADLLPGPGTALCWVWERWLLGGEDPARLAIEPEVWPLLAPRCAGPRVAHVPSGQPAPQPIDEQELLEEPFAWLAGQTGCDLAQGEFALRQGGGDWLRWRPLFAALGLCVLMQWGFYQVQGWQLRGAAQAYEQDSEALYRELFPEDRKLINLRAQFDQHLAGGGGSGQGRLLATLGQAAGALLAEDGQVQVQQLDFSDSRGDLSLQIQASGFEALERLRERLIEAGLAVELGSASREASGVTARLVLGGGA